MKDNVCWPTRPISVWKLRKIPGVFKQVSLNRTEQQLTKENVIHWAKEIANNISSYAFIGQRELSIYSPWSCMLVLHSQQTALWRNKLCSKKQAFFSTTKVVVTYKLVVAFELGNVFQQKSCCEGWIFSNLICVIYSVYCILKCRIPVFFLQHDYWLHYFRQMLFLQRFHS